jgi:hypothetical protein
MIILPIEWQVLLALEALVETSARVSSHHGERSRLSLAQSASLLDEAGHRLEICAGFEIREDKGAITAHRLLIWKNSSLESSTTN